MAQLDARLNADANFVRRNGGPVNFNTPAVIRSYLNGDGFTYMPVINAFLDDFLMPGRDVSGNVIPNLDNPLTELKDQFYYDHIPPQIKTFMDKFYVAFKAFREEVHEQRRANADIGMGRLQKMWNALFNRGARNRVEESAETRLMRQIFGNVNAYAPRPGRGPGRGRGPAPAPVADPFAAMLMAALNAR